jgi:RNase P/RNase MRP subunit POP5
VFFFRLFTLCSARVSELVIVWSDSLCERIGKWETSSIQIVGARLVGASVTETATILSVSRATVSEVMSAFTNHGKTTSAKRNGIKFLWTLLKTCTSPFKERMRLY